jgi:hypothetical protein
MMDVIKRNIAKLAECDANKHASFSKWTILIIWACSLVAEVGTFAFNKKLPRKEKEFIIRQELCAGGVSLGIMYLLADQFQKIGERLVEKGRMLPRTLRTELENILPKPLFEASQRHDTILKILKKDPQIKVSAGLAEKLIGFRNGAGLIASLCGTIIASNIAAPLVSNAIASYFFNKKLKTNDKPSSAPDPFPTYFSYAGQFTGPLPHNRMAASASGFGNPAFPQRVPAPVGVSRPLAATSYATPYYPQPYPTSMAR